MRAYDSIKAERGREVNLEAPDFLEQARELLSRNIPVEIRMSGGSMRPAIEDGDIIIIEPIKDSPVKQGDIVLYQTRFDTAVIHRVVRIEKASSGRSVLTRGDASAQADIPASVHRILGRVRQVERAGERINVGRPRSRFIEKIMSLFGRLRLRSER
jgi:signal peptidase I